MLPPGHALVSLGVGALIWSYTRSIYAVVAALIVGVFIDIDHLLDFYFWLVRNDSRRMWLLLHSYELVPPFLLSAYFLAWSPPILAAGLAFLAHILTDQLTNRVKPLTYFLTYRILHGFDRRQVVDWEEGKLSSRILEIPGVVPLLRWLKPWLKLKINL